MGHWGEEFFQGDSDLDEASYISEDAGIELYSYELEPEGSEYDFGGKGLEATREHLNSGVLDRLFEDYNSKEKKELFYGRELRLVLTAVLAMRVGATISQKHLDLLKTSYTKIRVAPKYSWPLSDTGFRGPMKKQFEIALAHYKNDGTPYNFDAERCKGPGCDKAQDELADGNTLKKCGKCKHESYCCKECQIADWQKHKKTCITPEKRAEMEKRTFGGGFVSLNV